MAAEIERQPFNRRPDIRNRLTCNHSNQYTVAINVVHDIMQSQQNNVAISKVCEIFQSMLSLIFMKACNHSNQYNVVIMQFMTSCNQCSSWHIAINAVQEIWQSMLSLIIMKTCNHSNQCNVAITTVYASLQQSWFLCFPVALQEVSVLHHLQATTITAVQCYIVQHSIAEINAVQSNAVHCITVQSTSVQ